MARVMAPRASLLFLLLCIASCTHAFDWKSCGTGDAKFSVKDVTLKPEPVSPGATALFSIDATSAVEVSAGAISMTVQYAGFPIWTQQDDLCSKMACPAASGPVSVVFQQEFPIITPPGQYVVTLKGTGAALEELFCVQVTFQVVAGALTAKKSSASDALQQSRRLLAV